ncbi:MAG: glycosyltransferase family 2 protein [Solirubrobacterales bacterium]
MTRLSVVVVTHNCLGAVRRSLPPLVDQLAGGDELIVVDNASADGTPALVRELAPGATVLQPGRNLGFGGGCNSGAVRASGDLLLFLNPDAMPAPGFREAIARPLAEGRGWAAWMGLVTAEGGRVVNTEGGVVHFTGIAWAGGAGRPLEGDGPGAGEVGFASGACLAVPRETWEREGRFPAEFFLYHEDVDLSLRLRLAGGRVGIEPGARVDHEYEFRKGAAKWRHLERNRWATIVRTYPAPLLVLLTPALLATELALVGVAIAGGWGRQKLLAWADLARWLPRLRRERAEIQSRRAIGAGGFASSLTAELSSVYLGPLAGVGALRWALRAYWSVVRVLLRAAG